MPNNVIGLAGVRRALEALFGPLDLQPLASQIYGFYTALVYFTPIFGGLLADRVLGQRRTVVVGADAHGDRPFHDGGRAALPLRIARAHPRQRRLQAEYLHPGRRPLSAWRPASRPRLSRSSMSASISAHFSRRSSAAHWARRSAWHYGFAAAGVGMVIGLGIYLYALCRYCRPTPKPKSRRRPRTDRAKTARAASEWGGLHRAARSLRAEHLFWAAYEQQGNTIALWADAEHRPQHSRSSAGIRANPDDLVPGRQSVPDLRLHAARRRALDAAGGARRRAVERDQNGARLFRRRARPISSSRSPRLACRRGQGELALAHRLFRQF